MATVVLALAGEGRGHATRARTLVEALRARHRVLVYASGDAHDLLAPAYAGGDVGLRRLPGLRFRYDARGRLDYLRSGAGALGYLCDLPALVRRLAAELEREAPDLLITDFEPALPRAAERIGLPYVSVSHQHLLATSELDCLPARLRRRAAWMGRFVRAWHRRQRVTIVSSFWSPPPRAGVHGLHQVGVLLRPALRALRPQSGEHLLVYARRALPPAATRALLALGRAVRVYGLGAGPARGRVEFRAIEERAFLEDLGSCAALACTAGNQLVGEAFHLGKPVLALPEPGNFEQQVNAHLVELSGGGRWLDPERLCAADLREFLDTLVPHQERLRHLRVDGTSRTLALIEAQLAAVASTVTAPAEAARPAAVA